MKMPDPMIPPITSIVASNNPIRRDRVGFGSIDVGTDVCTDVFTYGLRRAVETWQSAANSIAVPGVWRQVPRQMRSMTICNFAIMRDFNKERQVKAVLWS